MVDLTEHIVACGGVFGPLADPDFFQQVTVDSQAGTIVWPNGVDLCPDVVSGCNVQPGNRQAITGSSARGLSASPPGCPEYS